MMLSRESEEFIANLKMYLMTSGKNDEEINEIADELQAHLEDAESRGKTVDSVTGGSPESYLKNLSSEMQTDIFGLLKLMPMFALLLLAYFITGSAIRGDLDFSLLKIVAYPLIALLSIAAYVYFFRKMSIRKWSAKRELSIFAGIQIITAALLVGVIFLDIFLFEPFYTPSREMMWGIAALGIAIFIFEAIRTKTWITIILPLFLFGPDFVMQFTEVTEIQRIGISTGVLYAGLALIIIYLLIKNKKQKPHKA